VKSRTRFAVMSVIAVSSAMLFSGCSSDNASAPERAAEAPVGDVGDDVEQAVGNSQKTMISVDNQLTLPDGSPAAITWQVSGTQNSFWDGSSRPDHAPPQGFQGLVQESGSGPYRARAEVNDSSFTKRVVFYLTPTITVEDQAVALEPMLMVYGSEGWEMALKNETIYGCRDAQKFQAQTPGGQLDYEIIGTCPSLNPSFVIKSATN
jgi:hypothetical protein